MDNLAFNTGYYKVGNEIFQNKVEAVYRASQLKTDWEWYFHDQVMQSYDWTREPTDSLNQLYKIRAQQLREKYDYIVIFCSGGADSTNALYSFLKNGIHVDEVIASAPMSGLDNWKWDSASNAAENTISETKFAQLPLMQEVSTFYPKTKVTLHDYFIDMLNYKTDEWLFKSGDYIHPTFAARYSLERAEYDYIKKIADSGKRVGVIYGIDKPFLAVKDGTFYSYFRDALVCNGFQSIAHPNVEVELFYYSPELIPMLIKQAHVAARWICLPENKIYRDHAVLDYANKVQDSVRKFMGIYERALVPEIYPILDENKFQCHKPQAAFMGEHDSWFPHLHQSSKIRELIVSDYRTFINSIDSSQVRRDSSSNILGFKIARKSYRIGKESDFAAGIVT